MTTHKRRSDDVRHSVVDALAREVGIPGLFSDWPTAVTYYANCMGLKQGAIALA